MAVLFFCVRIECCSYNAVVDDWVDSLWKKVIELHPEIEALCIIPHTTLWVISTSLIIHISLMLLLVVVISCLTMNHGLNLSSSDCIKYSCKTSDPLICGNLFSDYLIKDKLYEVFSSITRMRFLMVDINCADTFKC